MKTLEELLADLSPEERERHESLIRKVKQTQEEILATQVNTEKLLEKRQDVLNELFGDLGRLVQTLGKLNTSIQVLEVQIRDGKEKQAGKKTTFN